MSASEPVEFALTLARPAVWLALSLAEENRLEGHVWVVPLRERDWARACLFVVEIEVRQNAGGEEEVRYGRATEVALEPEQMQQKVQVMRSFRLQNPDPQDVPLQRADEAGLFEVHVAPHTLEQVVMTPLVLDLRRFLSP